MRKTSPESSLLGVAAETQAQEARAQQLANFLSLPLVVIDQVDNGYLLVVTSHRVEIRSVNSPPLHGPVFVDFVGGKAAYRRAFGGGRGQPLARAIGLKSGFTPTVIDATAGLGRDAFVFASLGCEVQMIEQCPPVAALLEDGLKRAQQDAATSEIANRMQLSEGDAATLIPTLSSGQQPDVIYLDPMYPPRDKSAAVKKEMQLLQTLVGHGCDETTLIECARCHALKRVVVKRPAGAKQLACVASHSTVKSPNTRYDIYLPAMQ